MQIITNISNWFRAIPWESFWSSKTAFSVFPPANWNYMWYYIGFAAICYILLIVMLFLKKINPEIKTRVNSFLVTNIWLCLFFGFFRYQRIPIMGMDFIRTLQIVVAIFWIISIIRFKKIILPQIILHQKVEERRNKYLPKPKNK